MMRAWETGNEAEYRALTAPEFRMVMYLATSRNTFYTFYLLEAFPPIAMLLLSL